MFIVYYMEKTAAATNYEAYLLYLFKLFNPDQTHIDHIYNSSQTLEEMLKIFE